MSTRAHYIGIINMNTYEEIYACSGCSADTRLEGVGLVFLRLSQVLTLALLRYDATLLAICKV